MALELQGSPLRTPMCVGKYSVPWHLVWDKNVNIVCLGICQTELLVINISGDGEGGGNNNEGNEESSGKFNHDDDVGESICVAERGALMFVKRARKVAWIVKETRG